MSNLFTQLSQAAQKQKQELEESRSKEAVNEPEAQQHGSAQTNKQTKSHKVSSQSELTSSHTDVTKSTSETKINQPMISFDNDLMIQVVKELSTARDNYSTTLRLTPEEKKFVEDFIHVDLRRRDVEGNGVSKSKLMRYAFTYVLLKHRKEFLNALVAALKEEKKIGILT